MDIEAQKPEAPQYNRTLARARIATLAAAGLAGALTTAILALHEGSGIDGLPGRTLLNEDCSQRKLNNVREAKRALVISGATTGACFGGAILGACLMGGGAVAEEEGDGGWRTAGLASMGIGGIMTYLGAIGTSLGCTATLISGIVYGVSKNNC